MKTTKIQNNTTQSKEVYNGFNLMYQYLQVHNQTVKYRNNQNFTYYYGVRRPKAESTMEEPLPYIKYDVLKELMQDETIRKAIYRKFYEAVRTEVCPVINDYLSKLHPEYKLDSED